MSIAVDCCQSLLYLCLLCRLSSRWWTIVPAPITSRTRQRYRTGREPLTFACVYCEPRRYLDIWWLSHARTLLSLDGQVIITAAFWSCLPCSSRPLVYHFSFSCFFLFNFLILITFSCRHFAVWRAVCFVQPTFIISVYKPTVGKVTGKVTH